MTNLEQRQHDMLKELLDAWDALHSDFMIAGDKLRDPDMWERVRQLVKENQP